MRHLLSLVIFLGFSSASFAKDIPVTNAIYYFDGDSAIGFIGNICEGTNIKLVNGIVKHASWEDKDCGTGKCMIAHFDPFFDKIEGVIFKQKDNGDYEVLKSISFGSVKENKIQFIKDLEVKALWVNKDEAKVSFKLKN